MKEKESYGISCVRKFRGKYQVLLVQKRFTYAYDKFVHGRYNSNDHHVIKKMLDEMTIDEKIIISRHDFENIWRHIWDKSCDIYGLQDRYVTSKIKFDNLDFNRLDKLIRESSHGDKVWEMPKGRKNINKEESINCALREFLEETNIDKNKFTVIQQAQILDDFVDDNVRYKTVYYPAVINGECNIKLSVGSEQSKELCDIRWMDLETINKIIGSPRLYNLAKKTVNYVKKKYGAYITELF